jgi:hypothetical protein
MMAESEKQINWARRLGTAAIKANASMKSRMVNKLSGGKKNACKRQCLQAEHRSMAGFNSDTNLTGFRNLLLVQYRKNLQHALKAVIHPFPGLAGKSCEPGNEKDGSKNYINAVS